jgi:putative ABC transport system ATP-binding protein
MTLESGIRLESVTKHYATAAGPVRAVDGITLEVRAGSSVAITGPSGCGKSTLLSLLSGLETPSAGRVWIDGVEISGLPERRRSRWRRTRLGLVFQSDNLLPFLTAVENVALQLSLQGRCNGHERSRRTLVEVGLCGHAGKLPDQLSRGQRQRVAVARALVHDPSVVLADEPTGSLDAASSVAVIDRLLAAQRETGATLIVVTHDPVVAVRLDRTLRLRDGRLAGNAAEQELEVFRA